MEKQLDYSIKLIEQNEEGNKYRITIGLPMNVGWIDDMFYCISGFRINKSFKLGHQRNEDGLAYFSGEVYLDTQAVYRTFFTCTINKKRVYIDKDKNIVDFLDNNKLDKISVNFDTPEWAKGATMYHIFVDRFNRGSDKPMDEMPRRDIHESFKEEAVAGPNKDGNWCVDFYGGDLKGITQKLDYIRSLGVTVLYLSPIMRSQSNHRYDTGDYEEVDPYCGTNDDLRELCDAAHRKGMKVVLDSVFNHTGNDSKYFNELGSYPNKGAYQDPDSYYGSFYKKWYDKGQTHFDYWWGMKNLPVCNGYSSSWQEYIYGEGGVIDKWFGMGIDGLRLDVADELTDEFIEGIRRAVNRNKKDGLIIGEVWKNAMRMNRSYISSGKAMDTHMDYPLADALIRYFKYADTNKISYIIQDMLNEYPKGTIDTLMNFTSTHDISRPLNIFGCYDDFRPDTEWAFNAVSNDYNRCNHFKLSNELYEKAKEIYEAYVYCLSFMPGMLSIFYGDEAGVQGLGNLCNRQPFPWGKEDIQLLEFFKSIGYIREIETFLKKADLNVLDINSKYIMYERTSNDGDALVMVNRTPEKQDILIPSRYSDHDKVYKLKQSNTHELTPYGGITVIKK